MKKPRVILRKCDVYEPTTIQEIVRDSAEKLGMNIEGKVFIKPNVVSANRKYIFNSYTHPSVTEGVIGYLKNKGISGITVGESGGYAIPTRLFLKESGYFDLARRTGVPVIDMNEHAYERIQLSKGVWHREILLSKYIKEADFRIWVPKLKYHIFAGITNALKLNIGILSHSERMMFHDYRLHEKIVDLLEPGYPDLVVTDAIEITYGFESAPYPVHLGLLMIANDPLAADVVAAHIMGYRPEDVKHLAIASARGYGSLKLRDISIEGDAKLEKLRAAPKGNTRLFQHLNELDTPIRFFAGRAPDTDVICDAGCEGAVKGALGTIEKRRPGSLKKARAGAIVTGIYDGDVDMPGCPVFLVGKCTRVTGRLNAGKVYRVKGCPIGARALFVKLPSVFKLPSPMFDVRDVALFIVNSVEKGMSMAFNRYLLRR